VDAVWCVGDIVGYGPDPTECIGMIREIPNICVAGNHDVGVAGNISGAGNRGAKAAGSGGAASSAGSAETTAGAVEKNIADGISAGSFNSEARIARDWTRSVLNENEISFLAKLPLMAEPLPCILMAHGAPVVGMPVFRAINSDGRPGEAPGAQSYGMSALDEALSNERVSGASEISELNTGSFAFDEASRADTHTHENTHQQENEQDKKMANDSSFGIWEYVVSSWQAEEIFSMSQHGFSQDLFIVGHTHASLAFVKGDGAAVEYVPLETGDIIELDFALFKYLLNPGSVGQPRDGDPRASFMLYDTEANVVEYRRVEYDVAEVMERVDYAGLPHNLGARLEIGL
jgi:predicted phosphodiesterase